MIRMRGDDRQPDSMFSYVPPEQRESYRVYRRAIPREDGPDGILSTFREAFTRYQSDPQFCGRIVFVVRGPLAGDELPSLLVRAQIVLEQRLASSPPRTAAGHEVSVKVEYSQSSL